MLWDRLDSVQREYLTTVPLLFSADNGRAYLKNKSSQNRTSAHLYMQGVEYQEVANRYWKFLNATTVEIDLSQYVGGSQYFLTHEELRVYPESRLTKTFEHRSGANAAACLAAPWYERERNEQIDISTNLVHQLRLSLSGIRDLNGFRIRSLALKGLKLRGANPYVPGLTNVWGA